MARSDPQLNFRIPIELRDRLEESAAANKRSLTAELIERLEASFGGAIPVQEEALELERREVEVRLETLGSHRSVLKMHIDMLAKQVQDTKGAPESFKLQQKLNEAEKELNTLEEQRAKLLQDWQRVEDRYQAFYRKRAQAMDAAIDQKLQPEYSALADMEEKAAVPTGQRRIVRRRSE